MKKTEEFYQGYSKKNELLKILGETDYFFYESSYSFYLHFKQNPNWGDVVVDFGGRLGEKTRMIKNVVVVEIDSGAREWMKKNNINCVKRIDSFPDNSIDTIYASHVLEHLEEPASYLKKFHKKLKKGGTLILVLPQEPILFEHKRIDPNGHIYCWRFKSINTLLNNLNFELHESYMLFSFFQPLVTKFFNFINYRKGYLIYLKLLSKLNSFYIFRLFCFIFFYFFLPFLIIFPFIWPEIIIYAKKNKN